MIYTIKNGSLIAEISTRGAEPVSLRYLGEEYLWQGEEWKYHAPLLFPTICRLKGGKYTHGGKEYSLANHGFARTSEFFAVEIREDYIRLCLKSNDVTRAVYPFDFELYAEYRVTGDTLKADYTVKNIGDTELIYMLGWHPAFKLHGDAPTKSYTLDFGTSSLTKHLLTEGKWVSGILEHYPLDDGKYRINEAEIYSEDTLIFSDTEGKVELSSDADPRGVVISYSDNLPYLAVWKLPDSSRRLICIEPWSGTAGDGESDEVLRKKHVNFLAPNLTETFRYAVKCK